MAAVRGKAVRDGEARVGACGLLRRPFVTALPLLASFGPDKGSGGGGWSRKCLERPSEGIEVRAGDCLGSYELISSILGEVNNYG